MAVFGLLLTFWIYPRLLLLQPPQSIVDVAFHAFLLLAVLLFATCDGLAFAASIRARYGIDVMAG